MYMQENEYRKSFLLYLDHSHNVYLAIFIQINNQHFYLAINGVHRDVGYLFFFPNKEKTTHKYVTRK